MFDIGFWELGLIAVVALLILGPERLPIAARTAGLWIGKARRMIGNVKEEIDRELQLDEIRKKIKEGEESIRENTENTIADLKSFEDDVEEFSTEQNNDHDFEPLPRTDSEEENSPTATQSILEFDEPASVSDLEKPIADTQVSDNSE